jgi:SAM-dependent methyltransferase
MEKSEYQKHYELEESHWWFRGRREIFMNFLGGTKKPGEALTWLDAGCGTGFNLKFLKPFGFVFGCDSSEEALRFCRMRGLTSVVQADVSALPFKAGAYDAVSLLDVLYHKNIKDDVAALKEVGRVLNEDGFLLLTDSAFEILRSSHDVAMHGRERYRKKTLKGRLEAAGFSVERLGYFNFFLFPAVLFVRLREKMLSGKAKGTAPAESNLKPVPQRLNALFRALLHVEARWIRKINFPWGSSIICLAKKKPKP